MSGLFFDQVLSLVGKRVHYEAIANYAGNSFCKDSWKLIEEHHPFNKVSVQRSSGFSEFLRGAGKISVAQSKASALPEWARAGAGQQEGSKE